MKRVMGFGSVLHVLRVRTISCAFTIVTMEHGAGRKRVYHCVPYPIQIVWFRRRNPGSSEAGRQKAASANSPL